MRELSVSEVLSVSGGMPPPCPAVCAGGSVSGGIASPLTFEQFAARSNVPAQYMQSAYSSYFSAYPTQEKINQWARDAASRAGARASFNDYGPGANRP